MAIFVTGLDTGGLELKFCCNMFFYFLHKKHRCHKWLSMTSSNVTITSHVKQFFSIMNILQYFTIKYHVCKFSKAVSSRNVEANNIIWTKSLFDQMLSY